MSCCNPGYCNCEDEDWKKAKAQELLIKNELDKIVSLTHSWVMAEQTINCIHTYAEIRQVVNRLKGLIE